MNDKDNDGCSRDILGMIKCVCLESVEYSEDYGKQTIISYAVDERMFLLSKHTLYQLSNEHYGN